MHRIKRKVVLEHQNQENEHGHDHVGHQHVKRVQLPVHPLGHDLATDHPIKTIVDRVEQRVDHCPLIGEDLRKVSAHGNADQKCDQQSQRDLQPPLQSHAKSSIPFRIYLGL